MRVGFMTRRRFICPGYRGFIEAVRFLAERGADVHAVNEFGDTALSDVVTLGLTDIAEVLLFHGG